MFSLKNTSPQEHMLQAKEINKSLSTLRACLRARAAGSAHVPYRESTLTRVLKDALTDPAASTALVACVSPACTHLEHSLRTLRSAMYLTGRNMGEKGRDVVVEEDLKEPSVRMGGPKTWGPEDLRMWLAEQHFASQVTLPEGMAGPAILKLPRGRLAPLCGNSAEVAKEMFLALREASRAAAQRDLELRRQMKKGSSKKLDGAVGFARVAPAKPVVVTATETEEQRVEREALEARKKEQAQQWAQRRARKRKEFNEAKQAMLNGDMTGEDFANWCLKNGHNLA